MKLGKCFILNPPISEEFTRVQSNCSFTENAGWPGS